MRIVIVTYLTELGVGGIRIGLDSIYENRGVILRTKTAFLAHAITVSKKSHKS